MIRFALFSQLQPPKPTVHFNACFKTQLTVLNYSTETKKKKTTMKCILRFRKRKKKSQPTQNWECEFVLEPFSQDKMAPTSSPAPGWETLWVSSL